MRGLTTMSIEKWLQTHTSSLEGKTVAVTGTTGGLGRELCCVLASKGASLILLDRNETRSKAFQTELLTRYPRLDVHRIPVDLEDIGSVYEATRQLMQKLVDLFIHNAGAYSIPRHTTKAGYDNVFQINFASPYYMIRRLLPALRGRGGKVVVVGSIAHAYSKTDPMDVDFSTRRPASLVYGNAKRYLMFSLFSLFETEREVTLSVTHPGIAVTNITAHYPKWLYALIKYPMKVIFMKPKKACLSIVSGVFDTCSGHEWIGPRWLDVWGYPVKSRLTKVSREEQIAIAAAADAVYGTMISSEP
jgi:NAD(P)-dependent dehydrogenase (short-subunit alcohol dehydrogenase family)